MPSSAQPIVAQDIYALTPGFDTWYEAAARSRMKYDETRINVSILERMRTLERNLQFRFQPVQVVSAPDGTYDQNSPYPVVQDMGYTYYRNLGPNYSTQTLHYRPVQQLQRVRFMLNGIQLLFQPPVEWFFLDANTGRFSLIPANSGTALMTGTVAYATMNMAFRNMNYIPNFLFFDYIAGLPSGWQSLYEWQDVALAVTKYCAIEVLQRLAECINAGKDSKTTSVDGASMALMYSRFQKRLKELEDDTDRWIADFKAQEVPFLMDTI